MTAHNTSLTILSTSIKRDAEGRYCLNDCHKAAGGEAAKRPGEWMRNEQTQALIAEMTDAGISASPVFSKKGGINQGTYVAKELVYAYAMWISPAFHLQVIRAFDAMVTGKLEVQQASTIKAPTNMVEALTLALEQQKAIAERDQEIAELIPQAKALTDLSGLEGEHNIRWSAAQCQMKEKLFIRELEEAGWVYRSQTTSRLTVYARARDAGYMTVKNVTIQHRSGEREGVGQPMLTQKGLTKIKTIIATKEAARVPFVKAPAQMGA